MEPVKGVVVRATAGRDQGMFFVVLERNGTTVLLANGKDRPLHAPNMPSSRKTAEPLWHTVAHAVPGSSERRSPFRS